MKTDHPFSGRLRARAAMFVVAAFLMAASLPAQQPGLQFEVASIHPTPFPSTMFAAGFRAGAASDPCGGGKLSVSGTLVTLTRAGICDIIRIAYDVKNYQVVGVPPALGFSGQEKPAPVSMQASIADADKAPTFFYDIEARAGGPNPPKEEQVREMLRALLADRFHLTLHRENKELSYYALVPAKNGPKLTPAVEGCKRPGYRPGLISVCGQTMEVLAKRFSANSDRVVLDMTGITGKFDYEFSYETGDDRDMAQASMAATLEHLKLKLEPRKGPVECLVVDHVERPSEN